MLVMCSIGCTSHQSLILYIVAINIYNITRSNRGTGDPLHCTQNHTGWNVTALRQLQTEVNALVWRNGNFSRPNSNNIYQDATVVALQTRNAIEGQNPP